MKLTQVKANETVLITTVKSSPDTLRLLELGFTKNTLIKVSFTSITGGITIYKIRNSLIALRGDLSDMILVKKVRVGDDYN